MRKLVSSENNQDAYVLGGAVVIVYLDARKGLVTSRLGRSPDNRPLLANSHPCEFRYTVSQMTPPTGEAQADAMR